MDFGVAITTLLLAGLAGSLHCVGMCGPILIGFSQTFSSDKKEDGRERPDDDSEANAKRSLAWDFSCYHIGRIWMYGMLGFVAGVLGQQLGTGSTWLGWQKPVGLAFGIVVIFAGMSLLGIVPGVNVDRWLHGCGYKRFGPKNWLGSLIRQRSRSSRLLLGAIMGLLPCGLVYGALLIAVGAQSPLYSGLGMIAFGIGTVPALSSVLIGANLIPSRWRIHGARMGGAVVMITGAWMVWRSMMTEGGICACGVQ